MSVIFFSNIDFKRKVISSPIVESEFVLEKVDIKKIKTMINEGKLSDKEALYYKIIK
ncbi:MAG: hypothetical protein NC925_00995 [Candidatus Omnitrophica bacterium]|nr:hypothetical protein [Candidatus Omnitrophota bacterium]MCM8831536.1 hypothetical protein [Candidatus Omnitrophota bacterium]